MTSPPDPTSFLARHEHVAVTGSTNDLVRAWLAGGTPEVCLATADHQTQGRGRDGRTWTPPPTPGAALLASLGFRPTYLEPDRAWRLAAIVSLAMADAAEDVAGLPDRTVRLKWPNDLVVEVGGPWAPLRGELTAERARALRDGPVDVRKLGGVLGETDGLGTLDPRVVVGIGVNADWPAADFPADLAGPGGMTSLADASGGRPIDTRALLDAFLTRLEVRHDLLRRGRFDAADWADRQLTHDRPVRLARPDGSVETVTARGVDALTGALVVEGADGRDCHVVTGEIRHVRLADPAGDPAAASPPGPGCNAMARPVLKRVGVAEEPRPRVAHLDRDRRLVEAAQRDPARFEALYRRYLAQVYSYAYYELGNHHDAEDATERTFLSALTSLHRFEERARPADGEGASTFRVWLFRIARNAVANQRRRDRRHPAESLEVAPLIADPLDVEGRIAARDEAAAAWRAVGRLPGDRRRALVLRFVDEMSTAEIAGVLGRSEGAVRVLIHRALRAVARQLREEGS